MQCISYVVHYKKQRNPHFTGKIFGKLAGGGKFASRKIITFVMGVLNKKIIGMRGLVYFLACTMALMFSAMGNETSAQRYTLSGTVKNEKSEAIPYATVVVLRDKAQVAGGATDARGEFSLTVGTGNYTFNVRYIGYKSIEKEITITENTNLGTITLETDATKIEEVVVTAELIRREADRFVVDVANSPLALGKDGEELLKAAPGVWIQDDAISINGNSGSKIYLNDREVKMEDKQLMSYLRSLRANDIQRIEVIPQSGADYDASSTGGIIKITTRKRLDMGLLGSASLVANGTKGLYNVMPSVSLNYNQGKINAYGRAWAGTSGQSYSTTEHTDYTFGTVIDAETKMKDNSLWAGGNIGIVYDINERHSLGGEFQYNYWGSNDKTTTWTKRSLDGLTTHTDGNYATSNDSYMLTATLNYIYKLDDKGSVLKFIGDYTDSRTPRSNNYADTEYNTATPTILRDSTYRNNSISRYQLATATAAIEKVFSQKFTLKAGLKYTYNDNDNLAKYEYLRDGVWMLNHNNSYDIGYSENIGAAYIIASARLGRWSLVGGLRGEFTSFRSQDKLIKQDYFKLFPNANISYKLTKDGAYSLVAQYSRTISRPSFWALSPNETKISEYMLQRGNPHLEPAINNSVSVTAVLKYKFSLSIGVSIMQNAIQQTTIVDSKNPELLIIQTINYPTLNSYYTSANLPFQFTKWWSANLNLMGMFMEQRIYSNEAMRYNFMYRINAQTSFTLPKNFFIELDGHFMDGAVAGNTKIGRMGNMSVTFKKRMFDNKLTIALGVQNVVPLKQNITIEESTFKRIMVMNQPWSRPSAKFSISYNFNSGKQFRAKAVESGSAEDRSRIGGNN